MWVTVLAVLKDFLFTATAAGGLAGAASTTGWLFYVNAALSIFGFIMSAIHVAENSVWTKVYNVAKDVVGVFNQTKGLPGATGDAAPVKPVPPLANAA